MCERDKSTVSRYVNGKIKGVASQQLLTCELLTDGGKQTVKLLNEDQILEVVIRYRP